MRSQDQRKVLGIPSVSKLEEQASVDLSESQKVANNCMSRLRKNTGSYMQAIRRQVRLWSKKVAAVDGKLDLNLRTMEAGGVEGVFKQLFCVEKEENLLKAFKCNLSTTAGAIPGIVFISTEKVAFHSDKLIMLRSPDGHLVRVPYKVIIQQNRIKSVILSQNMKNLRKKYIQIVTMDNYDFWFMGFKYLEQELPEL